MAGRELKTGLITAAACMIVAMPLFVPRQTQAQKQESAPLQPSGNLYDMKRLLRNLETTKSKPTKLNQPIMIYNIKKGQLSFQPTPEDLQVLRKAGATEELLQAIVQKAGVSSVPPPVMIGPQEPPKSRNGRLTITCKPADCLVLIDNQQVGTTTNGELKDYVLPEGKATVSASLKEHIPDKPEQVIDVVDDTSTQVEFCFKPDPSILTAKGTAIFNSMIAALGGESALNESAYFRASGNLDVFDGTSNRTHWPFNALIRLPGKAKLEISKHNKKYTIVKTESGFSWEPGQKGKEFEDLEVGLRNLMDNHITGLVDMLRGADVKVEAEKLYTEPGEDMVIRVEREGYKYRITLNSESVPKEITLESGGLNAGLKVMLSKYSRQGAAFMPMMTEVLFPGPGMRGFIVRYEMMVLNPPGVKEQEFNPKKGIWTWAR